MTSGCYYLLGSHSLCWNTHISTNTPKSCNLGAEIYLEARLNKCGGQPRNSAAAIEVVNLLGVPCRAGRLSVTGTRVSTGNYIALHENAKADDLATLFDGSQETLLPLQDKFMILRASTQMHITQLPLGALSRTLYSV